MKTERYVVDGKEYDLIVDGTGLGGKVTPTLSGLVFGRDVFRERRSRLRQ